MIERREPEPIADAAFGTPEDEAAATSPPLASKAAAGLGDFVPRRWLRSGHLQTLAGNFLPRRLQITEPEPLLVEVDGPVAGYGPTQVLCHCHWQPPEVRRQRLTVVLVHGLEGSSNSQYILGNTARALAAGLNVVRMNMRSCGGTDHLSPTIYHSGRSGDVGRVLEEIVRQQEVQAVALVGYSMGGNLVLKYAGEQGSSTPAQLKALVGVSPLMDLAASSAALHRSGNRLYEWHFLRSMIARVRRRKVMYPRIYSDARLDRIGSMRDFDGEIVARYGGFRDADDYYATVASSQYAAALRAPTLIVHSLDDPFIRMLPATREALMGNPCVTFVETRHGGHCAFLEKRTAASNGREQSDRRVDAGDDGRWAEKTLLAFLMAPQRIEGSEREIAHGS
ncbi:MAG: alpha/beta fold hydrolase [Acidobacteriaceae bacterium]